MTVTVPTLALVLPFCIVVGVVFGLTTKALVTDPLVRWATARAWRKHNEKIALLRAKAEALRSEQSDEIARPAEPTS